MKVWEQGRVPPNFWSNNKNQRDFLEWFAEKHQVRCFEDWYKIPSRAFPVQFLKIYGNYHSRILSAHFPEYEWHEWKFVRTPHNFWSSPQNRHRYINWLGGKLGYIRMEDWYQVTGDDFRKNYGHSLIARYYNNSYQKAVMDILSEFDWYGWLFKSVPDGFWTDTQNRKNYMQWLGKKLDYTKTNDWYRLTYKLLIENKGYGIFYYLGSVSAVVNDYLQLDEIYEWKFNSTPKKFWESENNRHRYMDWLGKVLDYVKIEDWYQVTSSDFHNNYGGGFLQAYYSNSPSGAVTNNYPEYQWHEWLFISAPQSFWDKKDNHRRYMDWLGQELGYTKMEDWYNVMVNNFKENNGSGMLGHHRDSPSQAVIKTYSEHQWVVLRFSTRPQSYWKDTTKQKEFLEHLYKILGHSHLDDWYKTSHNDFANNGGYGLLRHYDNSHVKAIIENYSEHQWFEWKFNYVPKRFWDDATNRKRYMDWLAQQLGYSKKRDWYKVTGNDFVVNHGDGMLKIYFGGSPSRSVIETFSEYQWFVWMFSVAPQKYWQKVDNRKKYINWLANHLGIVKPKEWYDITKRRFVENYGGGFLDYYNNSRMLAIVDCFPDYKWEIIKFSQKRTNQKRIYNIVKEIWTDAKWEYKHPDLKFTNSGAKMELDIWIPSKKIGIEYQGEQHFFPVKHWGGKVAFRNLQKRDMEKRIACRINGIKLIEIPYTWDGGRDSLMKQIQRVL